MMPLSFSPFPDLSTGRLNLRRIMSSDIPALFHLRSDKKVMAYIDRPIAVSEADAKELIRKIDESLKNNDGITWGIFLRGDEQLIGTIGYWRIDRENYRAEIGYLLDPIHQGKGLMQEALDEVIRFGFHEMKLHSVEAHVNPENAASIRLLEKNKFVREACFRENYFFNGLFKDSFIYSRLVHWQ